MQLYQPDARRDRARLASSRDARTRPAGAGRDRHRRRHRGRRGCDPSRGRWPACPPARADRDRRRGLGPEFRSGPASVRPGPGGAAPRDGSPVPRAGRLRHRARAGGPAERHARRRRRPTACRRAGGHASVDAADVRLARGDAPDRAGSRARCGRLPARDRLPGRTGGGDEGLRGPRRPCRRGHPGGCRCGHLAGRRPGARRDARRRRDDRGRRCGRGGRPVDARARRSEWGVATDRAALGRRRPGDPRGAAGARPGGGRDLDRAGVGGRWGGGPLVQPRHGRWFELPGLDVPGRRAGAGGTGALARPAGSTVRAGHRGRAGRAATSVRATAEPRRTAAGRRGVRSRGTVGRGWSRSVGHLDRAGIGPPDRRPGRGTALGDRRARWILPASGPLPDPSGPRATATPTVIPGATVAPAGRRGSALPQHEPRAARRQPFRAIRPVATAVTVALLAEAETAARAWVASVDRREDWG